VSRKLDWMELVVNEEIFNDAPESDETVSDVK
jgi:hypothetical protein